MIEGYGAKGFVQAAHPPIRAMLGINVRSVRPARKTRQSFPLLQVRERLQSYWLTSRMTFAREFADFVQSIRTGTAELSSGEDDLSANQRAFAVYESARTGMPVSLTGEYSADRQPMAGPVSRLPILTDHSLVDSGSPISVRPTLFRRQMEGLHNGGWSTLGLEALLNEHRRAS